MAKESSKKKVSKTSHIKTSSSEESSNNMWGVQMEPTLKLYDPMDPDFVNNNNIVVSKTLRVYFASKIQNADIGNKLSQQWLEFDWTSSWHLRYTGRVPDTSTFAKIFWERDHTEVIISDVVFIYARPEDILRGALVEAGMALASNRKVLILGTNDSFGTWQFHPNVIRASSLTEARALLRTLAI